MEKEKVKRAVLVGNSLGGVVILETARLLPDLVLGLIAVDTLHVLDARLPEDHRKKQIQAFRTDFPGAVRAMVKALFHDDVDKDLYAWAEKRMLNNSMEMAVKLFESLGDYNSLDSAKKLSHPIRCICGDLYPVQTEHNRKIHPDFDAVIMPHTGHYPMLEKPEVFNRHLATILEDIVKK